MACSEPELPFAALVTQGLKDRGLTLRAFCRAAELDPSFFSKVLSGKRSPPSEESVLRRIASLLGFDPAALIVAAGRIPAEWRPLWEDPELLRDIHSQMIEAGGGRPGRGAVPDASGKGFGDRGGGRPGREGGPRAPRAERRPAPKSTPRPAAPVRRRLTPRNDLAEELL